MRTLKVNAPYVLPPMLMEQKVPLIITTTNFSKSKNKKRCRTEADYDNDLLLAELEAYEMEDFNKEN